MKNLRIALIQSDICFGHPDQNYIHMEQKIKMACEQGTDLILLPELWTTAYDLTRIHEIGDRNGERTKAFLGRLSKQYGVTLVGGSIAEIKDQNVYNTIYTYDPNGELIAEYRKIHLFRLMDEEKYLTAGDQLSSFTLRDTKFGLAICYDLRFPELTRSYALSGCKVLILPAEWPHPRLHHWRTLSQARAIENQIYVVACNRVGKAGATHFFGHSLVVDPWGEVLIEGSEEEEILHAEINLQLVDEIRNRIPVFADRRAELYKMQDN